MSELPSCAAIVELQRCNASGRTVTMPTKLVTPKAAQSLSPPPASTFVHPLHPLQLELQPGCQLFSGLQPASFVEDLGLSLDDPFPGCLALPTNVLYLLLQGATIDYLALQGGIDRGRPAFQFGSFGLNGCEVLAQRLVGVTGRLQLV